MRKTDDEIIYRMLMEGKEGKEIAAYFGVSEAAISNRKKKIIKHKKAMEALDGLPDARKGFALDLNRGFSRIEAVKRNFNCSTHDSAKSIAYELSKDAKLNMAISQLMEACGIGRVERFERLAAHMHSADPVVSLRAVETSLKLGCDQEQAKQEFQTAAPKDNYTKILEQDENGVWVERKSIPYTGPRQSFDLREFSNRPGQREAWQKEQRAKAEQAPSEEDEK
jgi:hypothetical protein